MNYQSLYSDSAKKTRGTTHANQNVKSTISGIKEGMTAKEIGNVISNRLMTHVEKAVSVVKQKGK